MTIFLKTKGEFGGSDIEYVSLSKHSNQTFEKGPLLVVAGVGVVASEQPERGRQTFRDRKPLDPFDEIKARGIDRHPPNSPYGSSFTWH